MKNVCLFLFLFFSFYLFSSEFRGLQRVVDKLESGVTVGNQYVLIIAINKYKEWAPLKNPVKDAKKIKSVLEERYFVDKFFEIYDEEATKGNIIKTFKELQETIKVNDSLMIFYAGHGYYDEDVTKNAYWIPVDGGSDSVMQDNWLPNSVIRGMISGIKSKHILLISDSCFSGDLLVAHRGKMPEITNEYLKSAYQKRSRQILTSGSSEVVPDESSFTRQFLLALEENEREFVDPLMIFDQIRLGIKGTTPMFGSLAGTDHQDGASFLFFLKEGDSLNNKIVDDNNIKNIEENYLNALVKINPKNLTISELENSYAEAREIYEKSDARNLKKIVNAAGKKLEEIRAGISQTLFKDIEERFYEANEKYLFDPAIRELTNYLDYEKRYGVKNISANVNNKISEINRLKSAFEEKKVADIKLVLKEENSDYSAIEKNYNSIKDIEKNVSQSKSKFISLEKEIVGAKEFLSLKQSILDINKKRENFKKSKVAFIASGGVVMTLAAGALGSGIASLGMNDYYGREINKYYDIYKKATVQSEIDSAYSKVSEYSAYSNAFFVSGIANTVIGGILTIPGIVLFAVLSQETVYTRDIDNIRKKIERFDAGFSYGEERINLSFSVKF
ncbi:MAG TPA: caspase family protein [Spirochaetota bacterium]|nr:caspase family protein [Spirochaetota bacterium]